KLGTIFFNPGGAGGSGFEAIAGSGQGFSQGFQGALDIVSWDPRGVGHTFPGAVTCFNSSEEDAEFWKRTVASYINETISGRFDKRDLEELYSQVNLTERKFKGFTERCQDGPVGPYVKYLGTNSTVWDLVSLGDVIVGKGEPIDYWGVSYGTVLGFNFVNTGHVILDGVVDPTGWVSFKTYSGLTDACAKAGRAGCKFIEFTGDDASGHDVKALLNYAHDVTLELYRDGVEVPVDPGFLKDSLYYLLYSPNMWSDYVNSYLYQSVAFALQASQVHNVTIDGGAKHNIPSGEFTIDKSLSETGATSSQNLTSYTIAAIVGADGFNDNNTTIRDVFDIIVNITREVTPTFGTVWNLGYASYGWPIRSVERLPSFNPKQLKNPVLAIGNTVLRKKTANILGDNAFLLEQLGFGHTSIAQVSSCTLSVMTNYFKDSTLPKGRSIQCPVDDTNLFPVPSRNTAITRRLNLLQKRLPGTHPSRPAAWGAHNRVKVIPTPLRVNAAQLPLEKSLEVVDVRIANPSTFEHGTNLRDWRKTVAEVYSDFVAKLPDAGPTILTPRARRHQLDGVTQPPGLGLEARV
ncbi:hypothetical protein BDM02DRAFT_3121546, partial [Thelephora ganbajun]